MPKTLVTLKLMHITTIRCVFWRLYILKSVIPFNGVNNVFKKILIHDIDGHRATIHIPISIEFEIIFNFFNLVHTDPLYADESTR